MVKKRFYPIFLIAALAVFASPFAGANFVCGKVNDSSLWNPDRVSASWFDVRVYYSESPEKQTTCKVSPADNKYCCDPSDIEGVAWQIGKEVNAEIFDSDKGYVAGPVSRIISGEGYDVFPEMSLKKVIRIHEPTQSVYLGTSKIFVNISTFPEYGSLRYVLNNYSGNSVIEKSICSNCSSAEFYLENLESGMYGLEIIASNGFREVSEKKNFSILDYVGFGREIECKRCRRHFAFSGQEVNVTITLNLSDNASGTLFDYFPKDWEYLGSDGNGSIGEFSETHNFVKWDVQGTKITRKYTLKAPVVFFTKRYYFQSGFENFKGRKERVVLFRFYRFFPFPKKYINKQLPDFYNITYKSISPKNPLVMQVNTPLLNEISEIAIFPSEPMSDAKAFIHKKFYSRPKRASKPFVIGSNIDSSKIEKVLIRFKVRKPSSKRIFLKNVVLLYYDSEIKDWKPLKTEKYNEDARYVYYESYGESSGAFSIRKEYRKSGWWRFWKYKR